MRSLRILSSILVLSLLLIYTLSTRADESNTPAANWRENYAYSLGIQAYIFAFPWSYNSELRWQWTTQSIDPANIPYAPQNQFWHARTLTGSDYRNGGTPNNDTLYSVAWLNLKKEPLILSVPDVGNRYYVMQMASMDSDNFAYIGSRTTGPDAGNYLITGPGWQGKTPEGVKRLPPSRTDVAMILGRTLVDGAADQINVQKLQDQYRLTPLSAWGKSTLPVVNQEEAWKPFDRKSDPLNEWRTINRALTENPPEARNAPLVSQFADIGVGPGQNIDAMDDATLRGLSRAALEGRKLVQEAAASGFGRTFKNGWAITPENFGRLGLHNQWLTRAALQSMTGIAANDIEEASYIGARKDADNQPLDGRNRNYTLHFAPDDKPDVKAFWSMGIYDMTFNFSPNAINRFSIGDRTEGLKKDADGGLTIYLQADDPGEAKRSNWLPIPHDRFFTVFRAYVPGIAIQRGRWAPPPLRPVL